MDFVLYWDKAQNCDIQVCVISHNHSDHLIYFWDMLNKNMAPSAKAKGQKMDDLTFVIILKFKHTKKRVDTIRILYWFLSMEKYKKKPFFGNELKMVRQNKI